MLQHFSISLQQFVQADGIQVGQPDDADDVGIGLLVGIGMNQVYIAAAAVGAAGVVVGGFFCVYQQYKLVEVDAACRGLKHPRLWGLFAASGNGQSGLILYLIGRRKRTA